MYGAIYLMINRINGMEYIGQTVQSINTRMGEHKKAARNGSKTKIAEAIREYGWDNFDVTILEDGIESAQELNYAEARYIVEYRTYWPDGYNMTFGGSRDAARCRGKKTPVNQRYVEAYNDGLTLSEVGELYGVCPGTVLKHLKKAGIPRRVHGSAPGTSNRWEHTRRTKVDLDAYRATHPL